MTSLLQRLKELNAWDEQKHDSYALRRFLRARAWDLDEAQKMWLAMLAWRKEWGVDHMLDKQVLSEQQQKRLMEIFPHGLHGIDHKGRPILIYRMGDMDLNAVTAEFPEIILQRFHIQMYEFIMRVALPACSLAAGRHVDQVTNVFDLKGLGLWTMTKLRAVMLPTMSITRDNYPETLGQVIIINAPAMFDNAYAVGKRMLSAETQSKIQVYGRNYQPALDRLISKSQLPHFLGGSSQAQLGDNHGPWEQLIRRHRHSCDGTAVSPTSPAQRTGESGQSTSRQTSANHNNNHIHAHSSDIDASETVARSQDEKEAGPQPTEPLRTSVPTLAPGNRDITSAPAPEPAPAPGPAFSAPDPDSSFKPMLSPFMIHSDSPFGKSTPELWQGDGEGPVMHLQGLSSMASFHTCISMAESVALAAYLQRPSVGFGSHSHAMVSPSQPPAITEDEDMLATAARGLNGARHQPQAGLRGRTKAPLRARLICLLCCWRRAKGGSS